MYWNFFRRIRLAPHLWLNLSKGGVSVSAGLRGLRATIGPRGRRVTAGLPGTGLSVTHIKSASPKVVRNEGQDLLDKALGRD